MMVKIRTIFDRLSFSDLANPSLLANLSVKLSTARRPAALDGPGVACWGSAPCLFCPVRSVMAVGAIIKFIPKSSRPRNKRATSFLRF